MSETELRLISDAPDMIVALWNDPVKRALIKESFAKKLSMPEFEIFVQMGIALGLNPFLREIWAVKYGDNAPQIFVGRDGYRKVISRSPNFDYILADAVYQNDEFRIVSGDVHHSYNLKDRGKLVGAYCTVKMKGSTKPFFVFAELSEYDLGQSLWKTKKATMIKKVAEAQTIRMACTALHGTYDISENWKDDYFEHDTGSNADIMNAELGLGQKKIEPSLEIIDQIPTVAFTFDEIREKMELSQSMEELESVIPSIKECGFGDADQEKLRSHFSQARKRILSF